MSIFIADAVTGVGAGTYELDTPMLEGDILVSIAAASYGLVGVTVNNLGVPILSETVSGSDAGAMGDGGATIMLFAHQVTAQYAGSTTVEVIKTAGGIQIFSFFGYLVRNGSPSLSDSGGNTWTVGSAPWPYQCSYGEWAGTEEATVDSTALGGLSFAAVAASNGGGCGDHPELVPILGAAYLWSNTRGAAGLAGGAKGVVASFSPGQPGSASNGALLFIGDPNVSAPTDDDGGPDDAYVSDRLLIAGNEIADCGEAGIRLVHLRDSTIEGNRCADSRHGIDLALVRSCLIAGNALIGNAREGMDAGQCYVVHVAGNLFYRNGQDGSAYPGLALTAAANCFISGNRFLGNTEANHAYALTIDSTTRLTGVQGNDFRGGYSTSPFLDNAEDSEIGENLPLASSPDLTERIQDVTAGLVLDSATIAWTYDDEAPSLLATVKPGTVDAGTLGGTPASGFAPASHPHTLEDILDYADPFAYLPIRTYNEDHSGACNGTLAEFATANAFVPETAQIYLNGLLQRPGADYAEAATADAIALAAAPVPGDTLLLCYTVART